MRNTMRILFVFGTRPEAIKLAPIILEMQQRTCFEVSVCNTGQHGEMLDQVLVFFRIKPDYNLSIMGPDQTLSKVTCEVIQGMDGILTRVNPDMVFVQGDTTTVMAGTLSAFYHKIAVSHVEAGLRSGNCYAPYPEEMNRILAGHIARYHFAPIPSAVRNLAAEGIVDNVWMVGNTVIDALRIGLSMIKPGDEAFIERKFSFLDASKRMLLVTGHRRENFGQGFEDICTALKNIANARQDCEIVYPVHLNPHVAKPVHRMLSAVKNIHLVNPVPYPELIWLIKKSYFVLTDSGGIQEEAPSLGKPVLVMRNVTERMEGIEAGTARLIGTGKSAIESETIALLDDPHAYSGMAEAVSPYGDGHASEKIADILEGEIMHSLLNK